MPHIWTVAPQEAGERLDVFLTLRENLSRSAIAKRLKQGAGRINGKKASVHQFVKAGDRVEFETENELAAESPSQPLPPLQILEETDGWIVINKPAGVLVHPDAQHPTGTLVDSLVSYYSPIAKIGEDPRRPGIMHRLDKEVGGLMVIAKTQAAFDDLKRQFAEHSVEKKYLALVHGEVTKDEGDIKMRIARSKSRARMAAIPEKETAGKAAWTHYKIVKRYRGATLLELTILTGRTHQIRAHMHGLGHPVVGDPLYTPRRPDRKMAPGPLLLQSIYLAFSDPATSERKSFALDPDPAFHQALKNL